MTRPHGNLTPSGHRKRRVARSDPTGWMARDLEATIVRDTPLGRVGQRGEVADLIMFLASEQARWLTGQRLFGGGHAMELRRVRPPPNDHWSQHDQRVRCDDCGDRGSGWRWQRVGPASAGAPDARPGLAVPIALAAALAVREALWASVTVVLAGVAVALWDAPATSFAAVSRIAGCCRWWCSFCSSPYLSSDSDSLTSDTNQAFNSAIRIQPSSPGSYQTRTCSGRIRPTPRA